MAEHQYATGNFANPKEPESSVHTLRHTHQHTRSNSMTNLHTNAIQAFPVAHQISQHIQEPLHPIMSHYGGELTSQSSRQSPSRYQALLAGDRMRESPLRSSLKYRDSSKEEVPASKQPAKTVVNRSIADESKTGSYGLHKSSINESSIHNKLSALRNVFSQIRQNLDDSSMTGTRTAGPHSSID